MDMFFILAFHKCRRLEYGHRRKVQGSPRCSRSNPGEGGGHQGEGLLVYLLARKKYRVISDGPEMVVQISHYKKKAGAGISFMAAGAVIAVVGITMM